MSWNGDVEKPRIVLPFNLGYLSTASRREFLMDLFLSSSGTVVLTVFFGLLLFLFRYFIDDDEEHHRYVEDMEQKQLEKKWERHNAKWGTAEKAPKLIQRNPTGPLPNTSEKIIATEPLPTKVDIIGDIKSATTIVLTYHDIAMNSRWTFSRLMHCMNSAGMLRGTVAIVQVNAPGHEDGAKPIAGPSIDKLIEKSVNALNIEALAQQLHTIVEDLGLCNPPDENSKYSRKFLGFGVGGGANVLLRYASNMADGDTGAFNKKVAGLILVNPSVSLPSRSEAFALGLVRWVMTWPLRSLSGSCERMARIHYSTRALSSRSLPRAFARQYRNAVEWENRQWFIDAYRCRDAIDDDRLKKLKGVPIMCFSASESEGIEFIDNAFAQHATDDMVFSLMQDHGHQRVSHIRIRGCGNQVCEERAEELLQPIRNFAAGVHMTFG